jgi:hypothetical protein
MACLQSGLCPIFVVQIQKHGRLALTSTSSRVAVARWHCQKLLNRQAAGATLQHKGSSRIQRAHIRRGAGRRAEGKHTPRHKYIICIMRILGCSLFDGLFLDWFQASATLGAHVLRGRSLGLSRGFAAFGGNSSLQGRAA